MSFSFNGPSYRPMIQESQSMKNNGGGGNAGYMYSERKKKNKKAIDVFSESQDESDEFVLTNTSPMPPKDKILNKIIEKTKDFVNQPPKTEAKEESKSSNNPFAALIDEETE